MTKNIKLLRLITGEELLAEVLEETIMEVKVKRPVRVLVVPSKANPQNPSIGLAPWMEFSKDTEFVLAKDHVLVLSSPLKEFEQQYTSLFSGIVTAHPSLLLPK